MIGTIRKRTSGGGENIDRETVLKIGLKKVCKLCIK